MSRATTSTMGWNAYEKAGTHVIAGHGGAAPAARAGRRSPMSGPHRPASAGQLLSPASVAEGGEQLPCPAGIEAKRVAILVEELVDARHPGQLFARNLVEPHCPGVEVASGNRF